MTSMDGNCIVQRHDEACSDEAGRSTGHGQNRWESHRRTGNPARLGWDRDGSDGTEMARRPGRMDRHSVEGSIGRSLGMSGREKSRRAWSMGADDSTRDVALCQGWSTGADEYEGWRGAAPGRCVWMVSVKTRSAEACCSDGSVPACLATNGSVASTRCAVTRSDLPRLVPRTGMTRWDPRRNGSSKGEDQQGSYRTCHQSRQDTQSNSIGLSLRLT